MGDASRSHVLNGFLGRCPQCGKGGLFKSYLNLNKSCDNCQLNFGFAESGDGPAFFIMILVGFAVVVAAIMTEVAYRPPYWVHALMWPPLIFLLSALLLRPLKGLMIGLQFKHQAREGRLDR